MKNFGDFIKSHRDIIGITAQKMADLTGFKQPNISKWEKGSAFPKAADLRKLSEVLKVDYETLLEKWRSEKRNKNIKTLESVINEPIVKYGGKKMSQSEALVLAIIHDYAEFMSTHFKNKTSQNIIDGIFERAESIMSGKHINEDKKG